MNSDKRTTNGMKSRIELSETLEDLRNKRTEKKNELSLFAEIYGKKIPKINEPERGQRCLRDFVLDDIQKLTYFVLTNMRERKRFLSKKEAKKASNIINKRLKAKEEEEKNRLKKLKETAKQLSRNVYKGFWQSTFKIHKFSLNQQNKLKEKENQKKRLNNLIKQQLKLSAQLASVLNSDSTPQDNERDYILGKRRADRDFKFKPDGIVVEITKCAEKGIYTFKKLYIKKKSAKKPKKHILEIMDSTKIDPHSIQPPILLRGNLRQYQFQGLKWLLSLHQKNLNGILADEMGLGKTIQTIALLSFLAGELAIWGPHLVIVPTTLLINWEMEFKRWCPGLKIFTYFGRLNERKEKRKGWSQLNAFHVCITSYKIATLEAKVFRRRKWYYMVLDEAQQIKNSDSQTWQNLVNFQTQRRLLLTGTPLQNDLIELWSLLAFLMPGRFQSHSDFKEWFSEPLQRALSENRTINKEIIENLHSILRPFLLRRLKKDVEKELPTKTEVIIKVPLSMRQKYLYDEFINHDVRKHSNNDFLNLMNLLMQLRKICNHPDLIKPREVLTPHYQGHLSYMFPGTCYLLDCNSLSKAISFVDVGMSMIEFDVLKRIRIENATIMKTKLSILKEAELSSNKLNKKINELYAIQRAELVETVALRSNSFIDYSFLAMCHSLTNIVTLQKNKEIFTQDFYHRIDCFLKEYDEFLFLVQPIIAAPIQFYLSYKQPMEHKQIEFLDGERHKLRPVLEPFYQFQHLSIIQLPKKKNIIYDSGKLNRLIQILRDLRAEKHKCLIFTQVLTSVIIRCLRCLMYWKWLCR